MKPIKSAELLQRTEFAELVQDELQHIYTAYRKQAADIDPEAASLLEVMESFISRSGKRLRPYLTYLAYRGLGGANQSAIIKAAVSQELLHHYLLIHDDIMDRDTVRYGGPNLTGSYLERFIAQPPQRRRASAESVALIAGDLTASFAYEALLGSGFPDRLTIAAVRYLNRTIFEVGSGQHLDVMMPLLPQRDITTARLITMYTYKTAHYSFVGPLQLGALLAAADSSVLAATARFGVALGVAFQIIDDQLGVFGDSRQTGKSALSDLREGKRTLLVQMALERAKPAQRKALLELLGNRRSNRHDLALFQQLLAATGAKERASDTAHQYAMQAKANLNKIPFTAGAHEQLLMLVDFTLRRQQ